MVSLEWGRKKKPTGKDFLVAKFKFDDEDSIKEFEDLVKKYGFTPEITNNLGSGIVVVKAKGVNFEKFIEISQFIEEK